MSNNVEMHPVESSHIESLGHDGGREMHVVYKGGKRYTFDCPADKFQEILTAESVGKAIRQLGAGNKWAPPEEEGE